MGCVFNYGYTANEKMQRCFFIDLEIRIFKTFEKFHFICLTGNLNFLSIDLNDFYFNFYVFFKILVVGNGVGRQNIWSKHAQIFRKTVFIDPTQTR